MTQHIDESHETLSDRADAYDALADLFLDDAPPLRLTDRDDAEAAHDQRAVHAPSPEPPKSSPQSMRAPRVQSLVLGHLPVLAGAWAAQHARLLASEDGRPVALLRLSAEHATVQVFGDRALTRTLGEHANLEDATHEMARLGASWLVRVDATDELDVATADQTREVCVLSGADGVATVAAYRTLKALHEAAPGDAEERETCVRLMGADNDRAAEAQTKIARVTRAFLSCDIRFLPAAARIDAGAGATILRLDHAIDPIKALELIARASPEPAMEDAPRIEPASEPQADQPEPVAAPPRNDSADRGLPAAPESSLAERIGLRSLSLRCPAAPAIELALDESSRLHLLAPNIDAAADLVAAEGWAQANRDLLRAAAGLSGEPAVEIIARVLTETPARDRRLLDGRYRVDLLREVRVGDDSAWCCVPLNVDEPAAAP